MANKYSFCGDNIGAAKYLFPALVKKIQFEMTKTQKGRQADN